MKAQTFSINHAAECLERDRRTVARALRGVPPDSRENKSPRWKLRTIVDAMAARDRSTGRANPNVNADLTRLVDEIEATWTQHDRALARLKAEPDLARRRTLSREIGPLIERLDRLMTSANEANVETGAMMQVVSEKLVGSAISHVIELCKWWPEIEAEKQQLRAARDPR